MTNTTHAKSNPRTFIHPEATVLTYYNAMLDRRAFIIPYLAKSDGSIVPPPYLANCSMPSSRFPRNRPNPSLSLSLDFFPSFSLLRFLSLFLSPFSNSACSSFLSSSISTDQKRIGLRLQMRPDEYLHARREPKVTNLCMYSILVIPRLIFSVSIPEKESIMQFIDLDASEAMVGCCLTGEDVG